MKKLTLEELEKKRKVLLDLTPAENEALPEVKKILEDVEKNIEKERKNIKTRRSNGFVEYIYRKMENNEFIENCIGRIPPVINEPDNRMDISQYKLSICFGNDSEIIIKESKGYDMLFNKDRISVKFVHSTSAISRKQKNGKHTNPCIMLKNCLGENKNLNKDFDWLLIINAYMKNNKIKFRIAVASFDVVSKFHIVAEKGDQIKCSIPESEYEYISDIQEYSVSPISEQNSLDICISKMTEVYTSSKIASFKEMREIEKKLTKVERTK